MNKLPDTDEGRAQASAKLASYEAERAEKFAEEGNISGARGCEKKAKEWKELAARFASRCADKQPEARNYVSAAKRSCKLAEAAVDAAILNHELSKLEKKRAKENGGAAEKKDTNRAQSDSGVRTSTPGNTGERKEGG